MRVTIQIATEHGITVNADNLVTVMDKCYYGDRPDDERAARIYTAARHLRDAIGADFEVVVSIHNEPETPAE